MDVNSCSSCIHVTLWVLNFPCPHFSYCVPGIYTLSDCKYQLVLVPAFIKTTTLLIWTTHCRTTTSLCRVLPCGTYSCGVAFSIATKITTSNRVIFYLSYILHNIHILILYLRPYKNLLLEWLLGFGLDWFLWLVGWIVWRHKISHGSFNTEINFSSEFWSQR